MALREVQVFEDETGKLWRNREEHAAYVRAEAEKAKAAQKEALVTEIVTFMFPRWRKTTHLMLDGSLDYSGGNTLAAFLRRVTYEDLISLVTIMGKYQDSTLLKR